MPDDSDALVPRGRGGPDRATDRLVDGVVLVIAGQLLDDRLAVVLEDGEMSNQVEEPILGEDPLEQDLEFRGALGRDVDALDGPPGHEPLPIGGERADAGLQAVGGDQDLIRGEEAGDVLLVGLELVESPSGRGVLVAGILQLERPRAASR